MKKLLSIMVALSMLLALVACSGSETLESYYAKDNNKSTLDADIQAAYDMYSTTYSAIEYEVKGNEVIYTYTYIDEVPAEMGDTIKSNCDNMDDATWKQIRTSLVGNSGVKDAVTITYVYLQPSGEEVTKYSKEVTE